MTKEDILKLIKGGENLYVEFKKARNDIPSDLYDTVCSFSNREGGVIILGVNDDGTILGVDPDAIDKMKSSFITAINNKEKISPTLYLQMEVHDLGGPLVLVIEVPIGKGVFRHRGRIYDRNYESDIDITENMDLVGELYEAKTGRYFVNRITHFRIDDLRSDLIGRARKMALGENKGHPWRDMDDETLLRTSGLILKDEVSGKHGITMAAILLFGKDETIAAALSHHKSDAILRVENVDRYDDRDVILTNLLESYDRLMAFGRKHLSDPFVLEGTQRIGVRDKILREIVVNSLAHRDYASPYVAKLVIERDRFYTENANRSKGYGPLKLSSFKPCSKNPVICKVFREIGFADELGSGMRNTYKYSKLYGGGDPQFIEGRIFQTIIPLKPVLVEKIGPKDIFETTMEERILLFCQLPRTKSEIMEYCGYKNADFFSKAFINPLITGGRLEMTVPNKPTSSQQKYVSVQSEVIK